MSKTKKVGSYLIPFDKNGNQMHYAIPGMDPETWKAKYPKSTLGYVPADVAAEWRANESFEDTLTYAEYARGRSAAYFEFRRTDGKLVTVFLTDLDEMMPHVHGGKVSGRFAFQKRGQNYGCTMLEAAR